MQKIKEHVGIFLFLVILFSGVSIKLILFPTPFFDWDESIYAAVGREMIRSKSFFVPLWQGMPWLDKPPIPSLVYGLIQIFPFAPEISTRIVTLFLSCIVLLLLYLLSFRITKHKLVSLTTVVITAFLPIFFQRSISLNVDVFLILGWLGYALWYENTLISTLFLVLAVLSKSLLGFFPPFMFLFYYIYSYLFRHIHKKQFFTYTKKILTQITVSSIWFVIMLIVYKYPFIQYQFIDSHFKRVTSSIEQHFGQRTFYITVLIDHFKILLIPASISACYLIYMFFKKKKENYLYFLGLLFVPWFLFLNLTKTKIEWYIYPVLPQFAFLTAYSMVLFKQKWIQLLAFTGIFYIFFFTVTPINILLTQPFSTLGDHQKIALEAKKNNCNGLKVLVNKDTRTSYKTLKSMNLVISTTTWWGNHPSIAYYADTKTSFLYTVNEAKETLLKLKKQECFIAEKNDSILFITQIPKVAVNQTFELYQAQ